LIRIYIEPTFGDLPAAKLDAELLERFYARLQRCRQLCNGRPPAGHTCRPLAASTVRKIHFILRGSLERAVLWRHLGVNKAALTVAPPPAPSTPDPPTADEAAQRGQPKAHDADMDALRLVVDVGSRVTGWGRLVRTSAGTWFDPPLPVPAIGYANGRPVRDPSHLAVPVDRADFQAVTGHYERDGRVEGWANVTGEWRDPGIRGE